MFTISLIFWHETWLSLFLWTELLCLMAATILHYVGQSSVRRNPDDYVYHFSRVWWTTFRQTPSPIRAPRMIDVDADQDRKGPLMDMIDEDAIAELATPAREPESDEEEGESSRDEDREPAPSVMRVATLSVRVIPQQGIDEVVGWAGRTLKIRVTAAEDGGQANKSVIFLLATTLGLRQHQIQLKRGHYDEQKAFTITGITQADLDERLSMFS